MAEINSSLSKSKVTDYSTKVFEHHFKKDVDSDSQQAIGLLLSKVIDGEEDLKSIVEELLVKIIKSRDPSITWKAHTFEVSLTARRNCVVYLNEVLHGHAATSSYIQSEFVELQKVFLKYIFDKKA